MATHDYDIANQSGSLFRSDLNSVLSAIVSNNSSASAPSTTFAYMWWADTTSGWLKQRNSANTNWVKVVRLSNAAGSRIPNQAKGTSYTIVESDFGNLMRATATITFSLTSVQSLEDGFWFTAKNDAGIGSTLTVMPSTTSQTIEGGTSFTLFAGEAAQFWADGSVWHAQKYPTNFINDPGATAGPTLSLFRESASPAASDVLGYINFYGRDSGAGLQTYAGLYSSILSPTAASESGLLTLATTQAGVASDRFTLGKGLYSVGLTDQGSGTINCNSLYLNNTVPVGPGKVQAAIAAVSAANTHDISTSIPSWAKRITIFLNNVSTNGNNQIALQIGNGSYVTTGYTSAGGLASAANVTGYISSNSGFPIIGTGAATSTRYGRYHLENMGGDSWMMSGNGIDTSISYSVWSNGLVTLGGTLDRVRLIAGGADAFDSGNVGIMWE